MIASSEADDQTSASRQPGCNFGGSTKVSHRFSETPDSTRVTRIAVGVAHHTSAEALYAE